MSLYDESMTALKLRKKELENQILLLNSQIDEIDSRITPLILQKTEKQAQIDEINQKTSSLANNIGRLQEIIDADNEAVAKGLPLPSEQV